MENVQKPVRVLHVVTYMGRGGLETMLMNYYRHIDRSKVQFDFLVHRSFKADYDDEILSLGGKIYHLPNLNPLSRTYLSALNDFFKEHPEYKVVHSHLDCMAGVPLKVAKKNGVPVCIAHAHNSNQTKDMKYPLKLIYKRQIPKYADILFACSKDAGKWMYGNEPFYILNNAIEADQYKFDFQKREIIRKNLGFSSDTRIIGHVGRFARQKNHDRLIDIYRTFVMKQPDSVLLLAGTGELEDSIKNKVRKYGLQDKVMFLENSDHVPDLLQAMDVFVFPSLFEGLGMSAVEAQAAGLPCIVSDGVPQECRMTDLMKQIPLSASDEEWAADIQSALNIKRRNTYDEIVSAGYDAEHEAVKLEQFYLDCYQYQDQREKIQWQR